MFKKYVDYIKNNPEGHWFKRKLYGWGWTPAKWQGWMVLLVFVVLVTMDAIILDSNAGPTTTEISLFFVKTILNVIVLILICYKTGEKPKWMWGPE